MSKSKEQIAYDVYLEERKALVEGENESADQFDKNILALAGGALGISIVFLEKIAPSPAPHTLVYLCISWGSLVTCLMTTLASFLTSQHGYRAQRKILETEFLAAKPVGRTRNFWARLTEILNWVAIVCFIAGVVMLAWFSIQNIHLKLQQGSSVQQIIKTP